MILDLSHLVYGGSKRTPTGILRVELAYAEYFISKIPPDQLKFVVLDTWGRLSLVDNGLMASFVTAIGRYWHGGIGSTRDFLRVALLALRIHTGLFFRPGGTLGRYVGQSEKSNSGRQHVYVILSHLHMDNPIAIERLKATGKVRIVYFVHDLIPLIFPEYFLPGHRERHQRRLEVAARLADVIVANSNDTADSFRARYGATRASESIIIAPLGSNLPVPPTSAASEAPPYFVMVGTIEPRKNHLLILNLWRSLRAERGTDVPRLVIIGARGWKNEGVIDMLERSPTLRSFVDERGQVADEEMVRILAGARALLLPSFAEGYGLPLVESLALGVPVICSDLPVFREFGGAAPEFIDPLGGPEWRKAIIDYATPGSPRRAAQLQRLATWKQPTWENHFTRIAQVFEEREHKDPRTL